MSNEAQKPKRKRMKKKRHSKWNDNSENQFRLEKAIQDFKNGEKLSVVSKIYKVPSRTIKRYSDGTHVTTLLNRIDKQDEIIKNLEALVCGNENGESEINGIQRQTPLMEVVKEQELEIDELKKKIKALEFKLSCMYALTVDINKAGDIDTLILDPNCLK